MLHEITKGMDNAAEKINENFMNLVEKGTNERGDWRQEADGTLFCRGDLEVAYSSGTSLVGEWVFPKEFEGIPDVMVQRRGLPSGSRRNASTFVQARTTSGTTIYITTGENVFTNGDSEPVTVWARGLAKA